MQARELSIELERLISVHGDCPVYHAEEGSYDTTPVRAIAAFTQEEVPGAGPGCQTMVPVGTTYFYIT